MPDLPDLDSLPLDALFSRLVDSSALAALLRLARDEDLGVAGDVTTRSLGTDLGSASVRLVIREPGVVSGLAAVPFVLEAFGARATRFVPDVADGDRVSPGTCLGRLDGPWSEILVLERTLLNLVGRLCGVATRTRRFVDAVAGTRAVICGTRKTLPGWRGLEKYALRCGGATLHRFGLHDAALYKDNHLAALDPERWGEQLGSAIDRARTQSLRFVMVEVDTLEQLDVVLGLTKERVDFVLLDNMEPDRLREAVARRDRRAPAIGLEASGGVTLETVLAIAQTGVDRISIGGLTHAARACDVGLDA